MGASPHPAHFVVLLVGAAGASSRVVGGEEAVAFSRTHVVSVQAKGFWRSHFCGGTLLEPDGMHVLTAAHCLRGLERPIVSNPAEPSEIVVKVHRHDLRYERENACSASINIMEIIYHPDNRIWVVGSAGIPLYDAAIVKLEAAPPCFSATPALAETVGATQAPGVTVGAYVDSYFVKAGDTARVEGWGYIDSYYDENMDVKGTLTSKLHEATIDIISNFACANLWGLPISDDMLCASTSQGKTSCSGDSGGPLVYERGDGSTMLIGIVSWGPSPCGAGGLPVIYTRVSAIRDWVLQQLPDGANMPPTLAPSFPVPSHAPTPRPTPGPMPPPPDPAPAPAALKKAKKKKAKQSKTKKPKPKKGEEEEKKKTKKTKKKKKKKGKRKTGRLRARPAGYKR